MDRPKPPIGADSLGRSGYASDIYQVSILCFLIGLCVGLLVGLVVMVIQLLSIALVSEDIIKVVTTLLYFLATIPIAITVEICFLETDQLRHKRSIAFWAAVIGGVLSGLAITLTLGGNLS